MSKVRSRVIMAFLYGSLAKDKIEKVKNHLVFQHEHGFVVAVVWRSRDMGMKNIMKILTTLIRSEISQNN